MTKKILSVFLPLGLFFGVLSMPPDFFSMPGITVTEQRVIAIFVLAATCWVLEPVPIFATSMLVITLELLLISNRGLLIFRSNPENLGILLPYNEILGTFASPVIILFLGGFFLAMAAVKYRLDVNLARFLLKPFGRRPQWIMLGIMLITSLFSMFMNNTATTAMMLAVAAPILNSFPDGDGAKTGFALAVPVAANIGGMSTPIATPPNAIAMQYLNGLQNFSFAEWTLRAVPYVIILLLFAWLLLSRLFPGKQRAIRLSLDGRFDTSPRAVIVYATFGLTSILWMLGGLHGMNSEVVAMLPVAVFTLTGIIGASDLKKISWDVLWLVAGGIALGLAMEKTGLAARMVSSIPFSAFAPFAVLLASTFLALFMANFMSHTATANLLLPLVAAMIPALSGLDSIGGPTGLILSVTFACSLGMSLPISTPPNAMAMATGAVRTPDMAKVGIVTGIAGLLLSSGMFWLYNRFGIL